MARASSGFQVLKYRGTAHLVCQSLPTARCPIGVTAGRPILPPGPLPGHLVLAEPAAGRGACATAVHPPLAHPGDRAPYIREGARTIPCSGTARLAPTTRWRAAPRP